MRDIFLAYRALEVALLSGGQQFYSDTCELAADLDSGMLSYAYTNVSASRARIRYMAALFPDLTYHDLCLTLMGVLQDTKTLTLSDVRLIVAGKSLDSCERTAEVDIERIQHVGKLLNQGVEKTRVANLTGVCRDTVQAIDWYLGLSEALYQRRVEVACNLVRDGISSRKAAPILGVSKSQSHRLLVKAKKVLHEIGEVV